MQRVVEFQVILGPEDRRRHYHVSERGKVLEFESKKVMSKHQLFKKNLEISSEFSRYVLEHPEFANRIPRDALVVFLPKNDTALREYNLKLALMHRDPKQPLVYVHFEGLRRKSPGIVRPRLEITKNGR